MTTGMLVKAAGMAKVEGALKGVPGIEARIRPMRQPRREAS